MDVKPQRGGTPGLPGTIGDRTFVNNASFGAYAEVVKSPAYRDDKRGTTSQMPPDLLSGHQRARLSAHTACTRIEGPQALPISNNPYEMTDVAGPGRHARLDGRTAGDRATRGGRDEDLTTGLAGQQQAPVRQGGGPDQAPRPLAVPARRLTVPSRLLPCSVPIQHGSSLFGLYKRDSPSGTVGSPSLPIWVKVPGRSRRGSAGAIGGLAHIRGSSAPAARARVRVTSACWSSARVAGPTR